MLTLATTEHRRHFPPALHVGTPGGPTVTVIDDRDWDHGLRTELMGAVLRSLDDPPWAWVTRAGTLVLQDVDAAWLGPCGHGRGGARVRPGLRGGDPARLA